MRPPARFGILAVTLLVLAPALTAIPGAEAQGVTVLRWDYTVRVDDPTTGHVDVTITFTNLEGIVERVGLLTEGHDWSLTDVRAGAGSRIEPMEGGVQLVVESDVESVRFTVDVTRSGGMGRSEDGGHLHGTLGGSGDAEEDGVQYNSYLGGEFGVFKAESFALGFNYTFMQGKPFEWASRVQWQLPPGWNVEMPYPRAANGLFDLPAGTVLPRGFVAAGAFETVTHEGAGKTFRYAQIGDDPSYRADVFPYLEKATPYYERVYGNATGPIVLAVSAPSPMFRGGLGGSDSLFVHEESDLRVLAHEYAHVWQNFATVTRAGESTMWVNEGDADYHGTLSLFATDYWSLDEVNALFRKWHDEGAESPNRGARLTDASYGTDLEDFGYHKGALVLHALDRSMKDTTGGESGVADLLRALNLAHDQRVTDGDAAERQKRLTPVTNAEVLDTVNALADADFTPFFEAYVFGPKYPAFEPVRAEENLVLTAIEVTPERPREGDTVTAHVVVENRGVSSATKDVPLILDNEVVGEREVTVAVGATTRVAFTFPAPEPGEHQLRALYLEEYFTVVTPAAFVIDRVSTVPRAPSAGEEVTLIAYVRNAGDLEGDARVTILVDGLREAGWETVSLDGNGSRAVSVPWTFDASGVHAVTARVTVPSGAPPVEQDVRVDVLPADRDGDGVPDVRDPYPDNRDLTTKGLGNDVRNAVPAPGVLALVAVGAGAALAARRRVS